MSTALRFRSARQGSRRGDLGRPARSAVRQARAPRTLPRWRLLACVAVVAGHPAAATGQTPADPELSGRVLVGSDPVAGVTVVLHHLNDTSQGDVDSVRVDGDGRFSFRLPQVPDPARSDVYFASVRHQGVLYFGNAVTLPVQLDSLYEILAYDTAVVASGVADVVLQVRNLFVEGSGAAWTVTDLFQVANRTDRTFVGLDDGPVWAHPLPERASDFTLGQSDVMPGGAGFEGGAFVVRSPIPPGERLYVMRYTVPDPYLDVPTPVATEVVEILYREPAPPLDVPGLQPAQPVELEEGTSYRRYVAEAFGGERIRVDVGQEQRPPPVEWVAVLFALALAGGGVVVLTRIGPRPREVAVPADGRQALIVEVARLDERHGASTDPAEVDAYRRERARLLARLRELS